MDDQEVDCVTKFCRLCLEDEQLLENPVSPDLIEEMLNVIVGILLILILNIITIFLL